MTLRHELMLAWAALVVVQVLTLIAAVGLLARMTPAVEHIMLDNERSIAAVEGMLAELAQSREDPEALPRFEAALADAHGNVTERDEPEQLHRIDAAYPAAFAGDPTARERLTVALRELAAVNRRAMQTATDRASTVGRTGAWTAAVLGLLSMVAAIGMGRRLERRVLGPIESTAAAVQAIEDGDRHRRCPVHGPSEIMAIGRGIEALRERPLLTSAHDERHAERQLLLALLDAEPGVVILLDDRGAVLHANVAGTTALLGDHALGLAVRDPEAPLPPGFSRQPLGSEGATVIRGPATADLGHDRVAGPGA